MLNLRVEEASAGEKREKPQSVVAVYEKVLLIKDLTQPFIQEAQEVGGQHTTALGGEL